ncbi:hypothetical protein B0I37DRAFT_386586 [Chaetomium sp. MPI-CAGE-AT-0009]|nr:hypothetical protein B0I37DRAFT_386586 [Chaetomium sp. MPI-CAGE-AT-0009]
MATPSSTLTGLIRFTPAPSCGIDTDLWVVTKTCYMYGDDRTPALEINPPWIDCTAIQAGEPPDKFNRDCYNRAVTTRTGPDGVASWVSNCPVGYTGARTNTFPVFYRTVTDAGPSTTRTEAADVVGVQVYCCPSISGMTFRHDFDRIASTTAVVDGTTWTGSMALVPDCRATRVQALRGQTVTLTPYSDTVAWERRRQEETAGQSGLVTKAWDDANTVYAEYDFYGFTLFGDGHTCFGNCTDYWLNSYTSPQSAVSLSVPTQAASDPGTTPTDSPATTENLPGLGTATGTATGTASPSTSSAHCVVQEGGWVRAGVLLVTTLVAASLVF